MLTCTHTDKHSRTLTVLPSMTASILLALRSLSPRHLPPSAADEVEPEVVVGSLEGGVDAAVSGVRDALEDEAVDVSMEEVEEVAGSKDAAPSTSTEKRALERRKQTSTGVNDVAMAPTPDDVMAWDAVISSTASPELLLRGLDRFERRREDALWDGNEKKSRIHFISTQTLSQKLQS